MGGKSRKSGQISKKLIDRIKSGKVVKNLAKKESEKTQGLDLDGNK